MVNVTLKELLDKKQTGKQEFVSFLTDRIKRLDDNSKNMVIGMNGKYIYDGYIGKNILVSCSQTLVEGTSLDSFENYIQFDGDERIIDLLYDVIQYDDSVATVLILINTLLPMICMDSIVSVTNPHVRETLIYTNTQNGKITKYSEIRNKALSMCVEYSMLFHNICKILALDSEIVFGTLEDEGIMESHAYNILKVDSNILVADLTRMRRKNKNGEYVLFSYPMFAISEEEYNQLMSGNKIIGDISYFTKLMKVDSNCEETHYLYGAGVTEEDKDKMLSASLIKNKELISNHLRNIGADALLYCFEEYVINEKGAQPNFVQYSKKKED